MLSLDVDPNGDNDRILRELFNTREIARSALGAQADYLDEMESKTSTTVLSEGANDPVRGLGARYETKPAQPINYVPQQLIQRLTACAAKAEHPRWHCNLPAISCTYNTQVNKENVNLGHYTAQKLFALCCGASISVEGIDVKLPDGRTIEVKARNIPLDPKHCAVYNWRSGEFTPSSCIECHAVNKFVVTSTPKLANASWFQRAVAALRSAEAEAYRRPTTLVTTIGDAVAKPCILSWKAMALADSESTDINMLNDAPSDKHHAMETRTTRPGLLSRAVSEDVQAMPETALAYVTLMKTQMIFKAEVGASGTGEIADLAREIARFNSETFKPTVVTAPKEPLSRETVWPLPGKTIATRGAKQDLGDVPPPASREVATLGHLRSADADLTEPGHITTRYPIPDPGPNGFRSESALTAVLQAVTRPHFSQAEGVKYTTSDVVEMLGNIVAATDNQLVKCCANIARQGALTATAHDYNVVRDARQPARINDRIAAYQGLPYKAPRADELELEARAYGLPTAAEELEVAAAWGEQKRAWKARARDKKPFAPLSSHQMVLIDKAVSSLPGGAQGLWGANKEHNVGLAQLVLAVTKAASTDSSAKWHVGRNCMSMRIPSRPPMNEGPLARTPIKINVLVVVIDNGRKYDGWLTSEAPAGYDKVHWRVLEYTAGEESTYSARPAKDIMLEYLYKPLTSAFTGTALTCVWLTLCGLSHHNRCMQYLADGLAFAARTAQKRSYFTKLWQETYQECADKAASLVPLYLMTVIAGNMISSDLVTSSLLAANVVCGSSKEGNPIATDAATAVAALASLGASALKSTERLEY
jgi:hypothetical protein